MTKTGKYALAWLGLMVLAILNGALRDLVYRPTHSGVTAIGPEPK